MRKYLLIIIIPLLFSCTKNLLKEDNEYLVLDEYPEKIDMINGIYGNLKIVHNKNYFELLCRGDDINRYQYYSGGTITVWDEDTDYRSIIGNLYKYLYVSIINTNNLIIQLDDNENPELLGEVYLLRAYCYFKLARFFGTPPLVTDIDVNYTIQKPTYREVYEFIESDLLRAIDFLPDTYANARIHDETPHKGTAKALLAEVYLAMAGYPVNDQTKYTSAAVLSGEVIENADYYGISLINDFADLWSEENRHNPENIFGLFFHINEERPRTMNPYNTYIVQTTYNSFCLTRKILAEFKYFDTFPENYRKIVSMTTGRYEYIEFPELDTSNSFIHFEEFDVPGKFSTYYNFFNNLKWIDYERYENDVPNRSREVYKTIYLLRYAQTLLTYAEAKGHLGEIDESAYRAVNMIRRRANKLDIYSPSAYDLQNNLTKEQFIDSVVWERAWELFFEPDGRWFDIIRLDLRDELSENRDSSDNPTVIDDSYLTEEWYFYLIPQEDRWLNPNFEEEDSLIIK